MQNDGVLHNEANPGMRKEKKIETIFPMSLVSFFFLNIGFFMFFPF